MKRGTVTFRSNARAARRIWGNLTPATLSSLRKITADYVLSVAAGEVLLLQGHWYISHAGLLRLAHRNHCYGIKSSLERASSDPTAGRWVFRAIVYKSVGSKGFVGYGEADPSNVSNFVRGAELRVAETRAVNRALRKAYGVALCSVEELGVSAAPWKPYSDKPSGNGDLHGNEPENGKPRLRDQLCLLIRQYSLDPKLVKAFANDFCGTKTLSEASRDSVESFILLLARSAKQNRDSLVCKLNAYAEKHEVNP